VAFYPDLTPYTYFQPPLRDDEPWPGLPLVNIGWLDAEHPYPTGAVPDGLLPRLEELAEARVAQTRGYHFCEFCPRGPDRELIPRESAEFRVKGDGVVYAVPQLALHYISAHNYLPPAEFCAAAMTATERGPVPGPR
jgi:hypothetical protein